MNRYVIRLKELENNFSYKQFTELLHEIDEEIINGNISSFDEEFIHYFKQIINFTNDKYIVEGKPGTLGHMLVENALINKERLTPTKVMCFFLEQKSNIGLDNDCNKIYFTHNRNDSHRMVTTYYHDSGLSDLGINWAAYSGASIHARKYDTVEKYNYEIMSDTIHELTHVYQATRTEQSDNSFDKLAHYDYQKASILIRNGGHSENIFFHQSLLSEFMADEQAYVFMIQLSKKHPEYFNKDLIEKKQEEYKNRKDGTHGDYGDNPRNAFEELISDIRSAYSVEPHKSAVKPILDKIDTLEQESQPIIEELQNQGISEKSSDIYYNIFLKSLYKSNGGEIVICNDCIEKFNRLKIIPTEELEEISTEISTKDVGKRTIGAETTDKVIVTGIFNRFRNFIKGLFIK